MATSGGSVETTLKKENGAAFRTPDMLRETTQANGRGITTEHSSLYVSPRDNADRSKCENESIGSMCLHNLRLLKMKEKLWTKE